jgi:glycosyltransferase involved in cell wall biosynthesis
MNVLIVHNDYGIFSGEEAVLAAQKKLLEERGHRVVQFSRSSMEIPRMRFGKARAFFSGIYSLRSRERMRRLLRSAGPDIVHIHNLYPFISPSVLGVCRRMHVPVVMTVHNYRLICPTGLFMVEGRICKRCAGGHEFWCLLRNCTGSYAKSMGYAIRNFVARKGEFYRRNVARYMVLTEFQRQQLVQEGFPVDRIDVIPNMVDSTETASDPTAGTYVGYVGRISPEKDLPTLMKAAQMCADIPFKAAGSYHGAPDLVGQRSSNFGFLGHFPREQLATFYAESRIVVLCSVWYEGFPTTILEAMAAGKPVVCSRIGGLPEIVEEGITGLLFRPGDARDLAERIRYLWERSDLCRKMGQVGREKVLREYSPQRFYERLMAVYEAARGRAVRNVLRPTGPQAISRPSDGVSGL